VVAYTLTTDIILSAILGFDTFLALPLVRWGRFTRSRAFILFNAIAIGILVFLLLDIYVDVDEALFPTGGQIANWEIAATFAFSTAVAFLIPFWTEGEEGEDAKVAGDRTAFAVALGIGFQNLTEGLLFGAYWFLAQYDPADFGVATLILVGYGVQNLTEGFPIVAAYMGKEQPGLGRMVWLFFVRGIPTVIGGIVGWVAVSDFVVTDVASPNYGMPTFQGDLIGTFIDGLAIGAIVYCILPVLLNSFQPEATPSATASKRKIVFLGTLAGVLIGFAVGLF
jgi:zinc transporter, ZIP family